MPSIDIIVHRNEPRRLEGKFILGLLAEKWKRSGFGVGILRGTGHRAEADLAILHHGLSVSPAEYISAARAYPESLNARIADIRKSVIGRERIESSDEWNGPVIIKSDLNFGGIPEMFLERRGSDWSRILWWFLARRRLSRSISYERYPSKDAVPADVWEDESLVVERYLPESDGDEFVVRKYLFLGPSGVTRVYRSHDPILRNDDELESRRETTPDEVLAWKDELGVDYGLIDYAWSDDRWVFYDLNLTPGFGRTGPSRGLLDDVRELAPAVKAFF